MEGGCVDFHVQTCTAHRCTNCQGPYARIGNTVRVARFSHGAAERKALVGCLHGAQRHLCGIECGLLNGFGAQAFFFVVPLRHTESGHNGVERFCVFVHQLEELLHELLPFVGVCTKFLPAFVPAPLVCREVCHHRSQCSAQRTHIGRNCSTAWRGRFTRCFFCKTARRQVHQACRVGLRLQHIFYHLFFGAERLEIVQPHGADSYLHDVFLRNTRGAFLSF